MTSTSSESLAAVTDGGESEMAKLARLIRAYAPHDGSFDLRIPGIHASRASRTNTELVHATARPSLCIIAQGAKSILLGQEVYEYDASRMLVFAVDLPVAGRVTRASAAEPYLGFRLDLVPSKIAELVLRVFPHGLPRAPESRGVYVSEADPRIVNAVTRLFDLLAQPGDAELLAPAHPRGDPGPAAPRSRWGPGGPARSGGVRGAWGGESRRVAARQFLSNDQDRRVGQAGAHERLLIPPALQGRDLDEPPAVPKGAAPARGAAAHAHDDGRRREPRAGVSGIRARRSSAGSTAGSSAAHRPKTLPDCGSTRISIRPKPRPRVPARRGTGPSALTCPRGTAWAPPARCPTRDGPRGARSHRTRRRIMRTTAVEEMRRDGFAWRVACVALALGVAVCAGRGAWNMRWGKPSDCGMKP